MLWGLYYALLTIIYRLADAVVPAGIQRLPGLRAIKILLMFVLTNIGWLIFREQNAGRLWQALTLNPTDTPVREWQVAGYLAMTVVLFASPLVLHTVWDVLLRERLARLGLWAKAGWWVGTAVSVALFTGILVLRSNTSQDFIYFQF